METLKDDQIDKIFDFQLLFIGAQCHKDWAELDKDPIMLNSLLSDTVYGYKQILSDSTYKSEAWITNLDYESNEMRKFVIYMLNDQKKKTLEKIKNFHLSV